MEHRVALGRCQLHATAFQLCQRHWRTLLAIAAVVVVPFTLLQYLLGDQVRSRGEVTSNGVVVETATWAAGAAVSGSAGPQGEPDPGAAADRPAGIGHLTHPGGGLDHHITLRYKHSMSEEKIVEVVNEALASAGIEDMVTAAGEFNPRGHSGAGFAGGLIGGDIGDAFGSATGGIGTAGGYIAGTRAHDAATGLPERMVVGVSETTVYGFAGNRAHPQALVFRVPREGLQAQVHQRVNVRVPELIDNDTGSRIELEGMRLPITHSKDVIQELTERPQR